MEGTEGKLCTRLSDGLCGDDTDNFTFLHHPGGGEVASVALRADSLAGLTGEHGTDLDLFDRKRVDEIGFLLPDFLTCSEYELSGQWVEYVVHRGTSEYPLSERLDHLVLVLDGGSDKSPERSAVLFVDDHVV